MLKLFAEFTLITTRLFFVVGDHLDWLVKDLLDLRQPGLATQNYQDIVCSAWDSCCYNVLQGLQEVRQDSISFNQHTFGNIFHRKRRFEARINGVHRCLKHYIDDSLVSLEKSLRHDYNVVLQ